LTVADWCLALTIESPMNVAAIVNLAALLLQERQTGGVKSYSLVAAGASTMDDFVAAADVAEGDQDADSAIAHTRAVQRN
jgi:hypothetical protein